MHPQLTLHKHHQIKYGAKQQLSPADDTSPAINAAGFKSIHAIIGALLYYALTVDNKLLVSLSDIGAQQAAATKDTSDTIKQLLYFVATYPNDGIVYRARNMVLAAHSNTGFHNEFMGCSRAGAHIFLYENDPDLRWNISVLTISHIIKFVMISEVDAELGALFITAK